MAISLNHLEARKLLESGWRHIDSAPFPPLAMKTEIEAVLSAPDITYKYILITGYLAKCVNPAIHARVLQVSSKLKEAYDARSLCHSVVVGFEKSKGNLFGLSNEPFVNKPARHPQHEGDNIQLRSREVAMSLHRALEYAQSSKSNEVLSGLVHILRVSKAHAGDVKQVTVKSDISLVVAYQFTKEFLKESDGGARLVAIWAALTRLTSEGFLIKVSSPNASDLYGGTVGDVEIIANKKVVSASECKQRPLNIDDVKHGIAKAEKNNIHEYIFIYSEGLQESQEKIIRKEIHEASERMSIKCLNIWEIVEFSLLLLNPVRRAKFGETVVLLLKEMRKFQSANVAADLWNNLIKQFDVN